MPKITINGRELEVPEGMTVIQAALNAGIDVPHYCYHPDLPPDGNCRMCLVEVEKMPKLTPSCTTLVSDGMVVRTDNDRVKTAVQGVLEFLLINHPVDCPVCDQAGECRLQDYYMVYGLHTSEIPLQMKVRKGKAIDLGPVMLDQERCILCSRCIRFFEHVTQTGELQFFGRGDHTAIGTFENQKLTNPYSGNVAEICPVGALTSHDFRFKARVWFLHSTDSVCAGCSTGCNVRIDHRDGTVFRLQARRNLEVNKSWLCDEGRLSFHEVNRGERLLLPTTRGADGMHAPGAWEETLRAVDAKLKEVRDAHGPESILGFGSPSATNEALYLFRRYMAERLGARRFEFRLDQEDVRVTEREDDILRHLDKHPNTMGALKLGFAGDPGGVEEAISAARQGRLKAGVLIYLKPLVRREGDEQAEARLAELIEALDYAVVLAAHKADWQQAASVVLPVAAWSEEDGTYTNYQGRVQRAGRAVLPPGDILPVWEVFASLLYAGGDSVLWLSPEDAFRSMAENVPAFVGLDIEQTKLPGALVNA